MDDERDRSHDGERPEPERPVGGSEWLLQQLSGGRLKSIFDAPRSTTPAGQPNAGEASEGESSEADESEPGQPDTDRLEAPPSDAPSPEAPRPEDSQERDQDTEDAESTGAESVDGTSARENRDDSSSEMSRGRNRAAPVGLWPGEPVLSVTPQPEMLEQPEMLDQLRIVDPREPSSDDTASDDTASDEAPSDEAPSDDVRSEPGNSAPAEPDPSEKQPADHDATPLPAEEDHASDVVHPEPASAPDPSHPFLPAAQPPVDLPTAPAALQDARTSPPEPFSEPSDGRPDGAMPPTPREPAPAAVYQWPDPRGQWDEPPVWEEVVASRDNPEDDGGDEELWRETAGAYAWNLEPTAEPTAEPIAQPTAEPPAQPPTPPAEPAASPAPPFTTAPAVSHVNSASSRASRGPRGRRPDRSGADSRRSAPAAARFPSWRTLSRRRLLIGLIALGTVILLAILFAIGTAVGSTGASAEQGALAGTSSADGVPSPAPTASLPGVGPLPAGTWAWNALLGGECVQPFDSVWAEEFTVVDCAVAHTAQLVATAELPDPSFPGQEALAVSVSSLCQAQGVVDVAAAGTYGDVQVSGTFPVTQEQWDAGERSYYCFVDRAGGGELTGSLAGTPAG